MMIDKQIIIDDVDVSGCEKLYWDIAPFLKKEERPFNQHEWKCGGGFAQTYCHNNKNCLYKQFKRKEQDRKQVTMKNSIILTGKEIETVYSLYKEKQCNIAIIQEEWNSIGSRVYVQTQYDYIEGKDNLVNITDYEAW